MLLLLDGGVPPVPPPDPPIESIVKIGSVNDQGLTMSVGLRETPFKLDLSAFDIVPQNLFFSIEGGDIRVSWDGSLPTPVEGHRFYDGQQVGFPDFKHFGTLAMHAVGATSEVRITIESA